jgi:hypothetical protein
MAAAHREGTAARRAAVMMRLCGTSILEGYCGNCPRIRIPISTFVVVATSAGNNAKYRIGSTHVHCTDRANACPDRAQVIQKKPPHSSPQVQTSCCFFSPRTSFIDPWR